MSTCSYGDGLPVKAKGLCETHYYRDRRGQDMEAPLRSGVMVRNAEALARVDRKKRPHLPLGAVPPIVIVAHPSRTQPHRDTSDRRRRERCADRLATEVCAEAVIWDNEGLGAEANHRRAWMYLSRADYDGYSVILEDDVRPVRDFVTQLRRVLNAAPTPVVSLYLGRGRPPHWQGAIATAITSLPTADTCWLTTDTLLGAVGYAIRNDLLASLLIGTTDTGMPIDEQISEWARANGHEVGYCWPSIVEHRDDLAPVITTRADGQPRIERRVAWHVGERLTWTSRAHPLRTPEQLGTRVIHSSRSPYKSTGGTNQPEVDINEHCVCHLGGPFAELCPIHYEGP
jgi:hypothetical protein